MCNQQRLRTACAYAQSDQSISLLLEYSLTVKLLTEQYLEFLSLTGDCRGLTESISVKMPHCCGSFLFYKINLKATTFGMERSRVLYCPASKGCQWLHVLSTKLSETYNRNITCVLILSTGYADGINPQLIYRFALAQVKWHMVHVSV